MKTYSMAVQVPTLESEEYPAYDIWKGGLRVEYLDSLVVFHAWDGSRFFFEHSQVLAVHEKETPYCVTFSGLNYTEPERIVRFEFLKHRFNPYRSGYGAEIPLDYGIVYKGLKGNHLHRVYMMQYGNSGSAYIKVQGEVVFLDTHTEYDLENFRDSAARERAVES